MYKGSSPTHTFNVSIDTSLIKEVKINYAQNGNVILSKRTEDCDIADGKIVTRLSQEDMFLFDGSTFVSIQLRVLTMGGDAIVSRVISKSVAECLDDEVLV